VLILIESAGAPVPGETSLIAAGILASTGRLSLPVVFAVAISAAVIGDNLGYLVGRRVGHSVLTRPGRWERQRRQFLDEGEHFFARHGGKTVFFGRWLPVLRFTAALLAGVNEMPWRRFFVFNFLGATGWVFTVGSAAYLLGSSASSLFEAIGFAGLLALVLAVAGHIAWRRSQRGREPRAPRSAPNLNESGE
jgi:membrane protein DedA with SNARE-associated domain